MTQPATYSFDPARRMLALADPRLTRVMLREPERCASVTEYAQASGIETSQVIQLLGPYLDDGTLALEIQGDEIFLHTAPSGRPAPEHLAQVPPNLWERLRASTTPEFAYVLWKLTRALQASGWRVETNRYRIMFGMAAVSEPPLLGVDVGNVIVPLLIFPAAAAIASTAGLLEQYHRAGSAAAGVVCDAGALEEMVTAVRRWVLAHALTPSMSVLILEAPRYNPTLITPADGAVVPRAVNRAVLEQLDWANPGR